MPKYFFHVYGDAITHDEEGLELADLGAALREAQRCARALACEEITEGHLNLRHRVEVEDQDGRRVLTLPLSSAFVVKANPLALE
jgi:hypothetical protein